MIRPRCSTVMVSAIVATTFMLCSTISTVRLADSLLDQRGHFVYVFVAHALRRLIEQHQLRFHRQRGRDLQRALAPVRQLDRHRAGERPQVHRIQQFHRPRVQHRQARLRLQK